MKAGHYFHKGAYFRRMVWWEVGVLVLTKGYRKVCKEKGKCKNKFIVLSMAQRNVFKFNVND